MKRPFTNYLKLLCKFLSTDEFKKLRDNSDLTDWYIKHYKSNKIYIVEDCTRYRGVHITYSLTYGNGSLYFYKENCKISLRTFSKAEYNLCIPTNLEGKDEFFNYIMQHDVDYLTYEDIEVLKEIKNLTIKITEKETING